MSISKKGAFLTCKGLCFHLSECCSEKQFVALSRRLRLCQREEQAGIPVCQVSEEWPGVSVCQRGAGGCTCVSGRERSGWGVPVCQE